MIKTLFYNIIFVRTTFFLFKCLTVPNHAGSLILYDTTTFPDMCSLPVQLCEREEIGWRYDLVPGFGWLHWHVLRPRKIPAAVCHQQGARRRIFIGWRKFWYHVHHCSHTGPYPGYYPGTHPGHYSGTHIGHRRYAVICYHKLNCRKKVILIMMHITRVKPLH